MKLQHNVCSIAGHGPMSHMFESVMEEIVKPECKVTVQWQNNFQVITKSKINCVG